MNIYFGHRFLHNNNYISIEKTRKQSQKTKVNILNHF